MKPVGWWPAVALLAACSAESPTPARDASVDAPVDAPAEDVALDAPSSPWNGPIELPFRYSGLSEPVGGYERAEVTDNVGTVTLEGDARPTLVAQTVDWSSAGYQLIHLYTTDANDLQVAFLYCRDGETAGVYVESLTQRIAYFDDATVHPCELTDGAHTVTSRLRPITGLPEGFEPVRRATVDGPGLTLDARGVGRITLGGLDWDLTPYSWVDCPDSMCGAGGWYEVHSLLRGPDGATGSVILYLLRGNTAQVRTAYGIRFDQPRHLPNTMYAASWSLL